MATRELKYADIAVASSNGQVQSLADVEAAPAAAPALRRKDGAKAPKYTREDVTQAAIKGRAAPSVAETIITSGNTSQGKVKSLRETVAKNAADYLLNSN